MVRGIGTRAEISKTLWNESAEFRNIKDNGTLLSARNQGLAARKVEGWVIMKKILFVASEAVPFIKTGGLADVVGSLPKCFDKEYFDVRVMIPKYLCIKDKFLSNLTYVNHFYKIGRAHV